MRQLTLAIVALLGVMTGCASPKVVRLYTPSDPPPRPNIVFIMADDHAWQAISAYGSDRNVTPHIDRIAAEGMRFDRAYVTNSICAPSRAVILTGLHSHLNGVRTNRDVFDGEQTTFPKLLRASGYQTAMIGKWHLKSLPTGFDHYEVLKGQGPYYNPPMIRDGEEVEHVGYTTDVITELALDWMRGARDGRPFLLMVQHKAPHRNWMPGPDRLTDFDGVDLAEPATLFDDWADNASPARAQEMTIARHLSPHDLKLAPQRRLNEAQQAAWDEAYGPKNEAFGAAGLEGDDLVRWKYQRYAKDYLRCVQSVDDGVGRILDELDAAGLADNTIVVYTSDQGWYLGEHGWYDKRWMYEESFRTPLLVRWPSVVGPGRVNTDMVQNLDFAPTFLEAARAEIPGAMQGRSFVPLLRGEGSEGWRESLYYHYYEHPGAHNVAKHEGVRTATHKLIRFYETGEWELYDLVADPDELDNLYGRPGTQEVTAALYAELRRLRAKYGVETEAELGRTGGEIPAGGERVSRAGVHYHPGMSHDPIGASVLELLRGQDPEAADILAAEADRQATTLELIASENHASPAVMHAMGTCLTNKYAEGYPGARYYGGCEHHDRAEDLARDRARELFGCEFANVQPHSGAQANAAVFLAMLKPGDTFCSLNLADGGHLSHGLKVNMSGKWFNPVFYPLHYDESHPEFERIDYEAVEEVCREHRPKVLMCGYSAYPREIDFARFREIADTCGALLMADIAHIAGLVAAGVHPSPFPHCDIVTTTTHKTLRGPRGGLVMTNDPDLAKKIDRAVFPGMQGGPLMHVVLAKAVAFGEALKPEFRAYQERVVANARSLARALVERGYRITSGGTDNHVMLVDLRARDAELTGADAEAWLERAGIITNKNGVPQDPRPPKVTSGLRLGTPALTTRGLGGADMVTVAGFIDRVLVARGDEGVSGQVREDVRALCARFPLP